MNRQRAALEDNLKPMDWSDAPYFLAIARAGSLRSAANRLGITHGTINRRVEALEAAYGARLFVRGNRGLSLTDAGQELLPIAEEAEALFISARRRLKGLDKDESGTVRVSLPAGIAYPLMGPILSRFSHRYPSIDLELNLTDRFEDITRLETDVSVRVAYDVEEDVTGRRLYPIMLGTYATKEYLKENLPSAGATGEGLTWISWGAMAGFRDIIASSPYPNADVRHAVTDTVMQVELVRAGAGMSQLPVYFARLYPELVRVPNTKIVTDRHIWVLLHSDMKRTTRVRRLVDFIVDELKRAQDFVTTEND